MPLLSMLISLSGSDEPSVCKLIIYDLSFRSIIFRVHYHDYVLLYPHIDFYPSHHTIKMENPHAHLLVLKLRVMRASKLACNSRYLTTCIFNHAVCPKVRHLSKLNVYCRLKSTVSPSLIIVYM